MLQTFLDFQSLNTWKTFFERSLIGKNESIIRNHFCQHPVLVLDFGFCSGESWPTMREQIKTALLDMGIPYAHALHNRDSAPNPPIPLNFISQRTLKDDSDLAILSCLEEWTRCLHDIYGKRVIILVDNFDTPLNHAFRHGFHSTASVFFKVMYACALKSNCHLEKACIFGNVEATESIFSTFDNVKMSTVFVDDFSFHFGFTDAEALACLDKNQALLAKVKKWYGGNHVGSQVLINPCSFMNWLQNDRQFKSFWVKHSLSVSTMLEPFIKNIFLDVVSLMYADCSTICVTLPRNCPVVNFADTSMKIADSVYHFLVHLGYLTYSGSADQGTVSIPNNEVRGHWQKHIVRLMENFLFRENVRLKFEVYNTLMTSPFSSEGLDSVMSKLFSLFLLNFHEHLEHENIYLHFFFWMLFDGSSRRNEHYCSIFHKQ
jgi:hypothetical protein